LALVAVALVRSDARRLKARTRPASSLKGMPGSYDLRTKYGSCLRTSSAFTEGLCNSSWAAAPLSSFSDRLCIASRGKTDVALSVEQLVSCVPAVGCATAGTISALYPVLLGKLFSAGVVSASCWPYTSGDGRLGQCVPHNDCETYNSSSTYLVSPIVRKWETEAAIMTEIYTKGSVFSRLQLSFEEWASFYAWKPSRKNIFSCGENIVSDVNVVVKLVGWGSVGKRHYWIGWSGLGPKWGDGGYFLIARGANGLLHRGTCGVQSAVWATLPTVAQ
jgi:cathepsin B